MNEMFAVELNGLYVGTTITVHKLAMKNGERVIKTTVLSKVSKIEHTGTKVRVYNKKTIKQRRGYGYFGTRTTETATILALNDKVEVTND